MFLPHFPHAYGVPHMTRQVSADVVVATRFRMSLEGIEGYTCGSSHAKDSAEITKTCSGGPRYGPEMCGFKGYPGPQNIHQQKLFSAECADVSTPQGRRFRVLTFALVLVCLVFDRVTTSARSAFVTDANSS